MHKLARLSTPRCIQLLNLALLIYTPFILRLQDVVQDCWRAVLSKSPKTPGRFWGDNVDVSKGAILPNLHVPEKWSEQTPFYFLGVEPKLDGYYHFSITIRRRRPGRPGPGTGAYREDCVGALRDSVEDQCYGSRNDTSIFIALCAASNGEGFARPRLAIGKKCPIDALQTFQHHIASNTIKDLQSEELQFL